MVTEPKEEPDMTTAQLQEKMKGYQVVNLKGYEMLTQSQYKTKLACAASGQMVCAGRSNDDSYDIYWVRDLSILETLKNAGICYPV